MDPISQMPEIQEALRRRAALGGSSSGIGAEESGEPMGAMAEMGQPMMQGGAAGMPTAGAMETMPKQEPNEATLILKALSKRLNSLPPTS